MRRCPAILLLAVLAALAGLRLSAAAMDSEALRCAIACGHAAAPGAVCCPMSGAAGKEAAWAACPRSDAESVAPNLAAQPGLVRAAYRLGAPELGPIFEGGSATAPRSNSPRPPDHVPRLLS